MMNVKMNETNEKAEEFIYFLLEDFLRDVSVIVDVVVVVVADVDDFVDDFDDENVVAVVCYFNSDSDNSDGIKFAFGNLVLCPQLKFLQLKFWFLVPAVWPLGMHVNCSFSYFGFFCFFFCF
jgi:hypothetical protein